MLEFLLIRDAFNSPKRYNPEGLNLNYSTTRIPWIKTCPCYRKINFDHLSYLKHIRCVSQVLFSDPTHIGLTHPQCGGQFQKLISKDPGVFRNELLGSLDDSGCPCSLLSQMILPRRVSRIFFGILHVCIFLRSVANDQNFWLPKKPNNFGR